MTSTPPVAGILTVALSRGLVQWLATREDGKDRRVVRLTPTANPRYDAMVDPYRDNGFWMWTCLDN